MNTCRLIDKRHVHVRKWVLNESLRLHSDSMYHTVFDVCCNLYVVNVCLIFCFLLLRVPFLLLLSTYVASSSRLDVRRIFYSVSACTASSTFFDVCCAILLLASTHAASSSLSQCLIFSFQSACAESSTLRRCVLLLLLPHDVRCIDSSKYKCVASSTSILSTRDA